MDCRDASCERVMNQQAFDCFQMFSLISGTHLQIQWVMMGFFFSFLIRYRIMTEACPGGARCTGVEYSYDYFSMIRISGEQSMLLIMCEMDASHVTIIIIIIIMVCYHFGSRISIPNSMVQFFLRLKQPMRWTLVGFVLAVLARSEETCENSLLQARPSNHSAHVTSHSSQNASCLSFIHIPKTGGGSIEKARLEGAGINGIAPKPSCPFQVVHSMLTRTAHTAL